MALNIVLILLIIGGIGYGGYRYYKSLERISDADAFENDFTDVNTLKEKVQEQFSLMLRQDIREKNMTRNEYEQSQKRKAEIRINLKEAAYGNSNAKRAIKAYISGMLLSDDLGFGVNEQTIDSIIPFNKPDALHPQDKFEILLYIYYNYKLDDNKRPLKKNGFAQLFRDYMYEPDEDGIMRMKQVKADNGDMMYDFTPEILDRAFEDVYSHYILNYTDKIEILTQRIFEMYKGFGAVDTLFDTNLDEIDGGTSGVSKDGYDIDSKNQSFSYESVWITIGGEKVRLSCIKFDSQEELIRVVQNIYKYGANRVLNKKAGYVISTMKNGSRIVVMRPPFASSYAFFARKFDSTPSVAPEYLIGGYDYTTGKYRNKNYIIPLTLIKWLILGERTCGVTGAQGTGKSTMLKAIIKFISPRYTLRVQEISAELNLQYTYPNRNIVSFQETESIKSQEGLNLQKKTNGDINIIGELAEAIQANFVIQTAQVASLFALFTHHAKTSYDYVTAIADNLLDPNCGIYKDKKEAIEKVAECLNIDIHLVNRKGHRYMERITEIIPTKATDYPTETDNNATFEMDAREYFKRETDRELFRTVNLVEYHNGEFILMNLPSDRMIKEIKERLSEAEELEFDKDMEMLQSLAEQARKERIAAS